MSVHLPCTTQYLLKLSSSEVWAAAGNRFHLFADSINWQTPGDSQNGSFQFVHKTKLDLFEYMQNSPHGKRFHYYMAACNLGRPHWLDPGFYPIERLLNGFNQAEDSVLLVDVGGSVGNELQALIQRYPEVPGRLILEDLPEVIDQIHDLDKRIEPIAHNFNDEQPIKCEYIYNNFQQGPSIF